MSHLLEYIDIKDFKCFKDFHAEGFKRINLIGGKNNVGKTAFMEAIFITDNLNKKFIDFSNALLTIENSREKIKNSLDKDLFSKIIQKNAPLNLIHPHGNKIEFKMNKSSLTYSITTNEDFSKQISMLENDTNKNIFLNILTNFLSTNLLDNNYLIVLFDGLKKVRKREELNKLIHKFDNDLLEVDAIDNELKIFSISQNKWLSIFEFGDGIKYYIAYICALWTYENKIIFIDEIENGVHYTLYDELWEIIFNISKEQNVQVFATTHSKEMIESYVRVSKKLNDKEITYIKLSKLSNGSIKAGVRDYNMIQESIEEDHEVRG